LRANYFKLHELPALLLGERAEKLFLFVHGQGGNKEEARAFAEVACPLGWQVLAIDLPGHGTRVEGPAAFDPWHAVPELRQVMQYAKENWRRIAVRATSIGCYFSLLAFSGEALERCLFLSPLVDMERMIEQLMCRAGVSEERLAQEGQIATSWGQTLSWEYLCYVRRHRIERWTAPTFILRAKGDEVIDEDTVVHFSRCFGCKLVITDGGEHWFHTPEELSVLRQWEAAALQ
jgi:esterase/lipase